MTATISVGEAPLSIRDEWGPFARGGAAAS